MKKWYVLFSVLFVIATLIGCTDSNKMGNDTDNNKQVTINETGFPIVDEKITIEMVGQKNPIQAEWKDMSIIQEYEEMTNIHIEWETPSGDGYTERFNLLLASGDYPDAFFGGAISTADQMKYGSEGIFLPLEDLIEEYAPNFSKLLEENPDLRRNITTPDGHIYALPTVIDVPRDLTGPKLWINKKWIDEAGLDMPKTVEDLYQILKAFHEKDSEIIPVGSSGLDDIKYGLMGAFGYLGNNNLNVINDEVVFVPAMDNYKEFLKFMHKLYSEGLLDQETFTQDAQQLNAKGQNMRLGLFMDAGAFLKVPEEESWDYVALPPLTSSINDKLMWPSTSGVIQGTFALTDKIQNPEAAMRWVDYFYSEEGSVFIGTTGGIEGEDWEWTDETKTSWKQIIPEGKSMAEANAERTPAAGTFVPHYMSKEWVHKEDSPLNNNIDKEVVEKYEEHFTISFPDVYLTTEQRNEVSALQSDIEKYVGQMQASFVVGDVSFDEWPEYIDTLKQMNVDRLVEINQEAYDTWREN